MSHKYYLRSSQRLEIILISINEKLIGLVNYSVSLQWEMLQQRAKMRLNCMSWYRLISKTHWFVKRARSRTVCIDATIWLQCLFVVLYVPGISLEGFKNTWWEWLPLGSGTKRLGIKDQWGIYFSPHIILYSLHLLPLFYCVIFFILKREFGVFNI